MFTSVLKTILISEIFQRNSSFSFHAFLLVTVVGLETTALEVVPSVRMLETTETNDLAKNVEQKFEGLDFF